MCLLVTRRLAACKSIAGIRKKIDARVLLSLVLLCFVSTPCNARAQRILCSGGFGHFSAEFHTGVTVTVSASKHGGFASHSCDATLRWDDDVLPAVQGAYEVDIDVLGANLGFREPVVTFQFKKSDLDRLMTYEVYSLKKPPRLLRTITGGDYYNAQDYDLQNRIAIWTDDVGAANGFENLPMSSFDFPPTVVLQFEKGQLIDVGSEYQGYYDHQIAQIKARLTPEALSEFRKSDGKLSSSSSLSMPNLHTLLRTKIKVLEIVWAYLYSGREQEAWKALAEMWPPADFNRIRGAIQNARAHGILRQVDGTAKPNLRKHRKHRAIIYDMANKIKTVGGITSKGAASIIGQLPTMTEAGSDTGGGDLSSHIREILPKPIYLSSPPPKDPTQALPDSRIFLSLVIDAAGKVQSARLAGKTASGPIGDTLIGASKQWNFIPGFRAGHPVASKILLGVSPEQ